MNQANQKNRILEIYCLLAADLITILISYLLAVLLRFGTLQGRIGSGLHTNTCLAFILVAVVYSLVLEWNHGFIKRGYLVELAAVLKYNITMVIIVSSFLFVTSRASDFSRLVWGYVFLINTVLTYVFHLASKRIMMKYYQSEYSKIRVLVMTDSEHPGELMEKFSAGLPFNYEVAGAAIWGDGMGELSDEKLPVFPVDAALIDRIRQMPLDEVFIQFGRHSANKLKDLIHTLESMGLVCHYNIDILEGSSTESTIGKLGDYTVISYSIAPIDYRRRFIKRAIDIVGVIAGLCITLLLTPFIAAAIKLSSKGPVLFSQIRIGKNGRRFTIYKFRSMYLDAEERKKELADQNEISGLMFKIKNDPRITPVGRFLRKTSLDELPQFYNVLRGDMSLVGTRPPTEDEFEKYSPYYRRRLCMTPGLTGLWQVSGRSDITDFDEVVKLDLEYIDNWSLTLDIKILIKTLWVVFAGKGSD